MQNGAIFDTFFKPIYVLYFLFFFMHDGQYDVPVVPPLDPPLILECRGLSVISQVNEDV